MWNPKHTCDTCIHWGESNNEYCGSCDLVDHWQERPEDRLYAKLTALQVKYDRLEAENAELKLAIQRLEEEKE